MDRPYPKRADWKKGKGESNYVPNHFSPERIAAWKNDFKDIEEDLIFKSDVYSLGLVIL